MTAVDQTQHALQFELSYGDSNQLARFEFASLRVGEPPWVLWRLGGLDLARRGGVALTIVEEAVDPAELVPLRGVARAAREDGQRRR